MSHLQILLIALILDYFIGDPHQIWARFPHPAVIMGRVISWIEHRLNKGRFLRAKGIIAISHLLDQLRGCNCKAQTHSSQPPKFSKTF